MEYSCFKRMVAMLMLPIALSSLSGCSTDPAVSSTPALNAQTTVKPVVATATPVAPAAMVRDPEALAALKRMGAYLHTLKAFSVISESSIDEQIDNGQTVKIDSRVEMFVKAPNNLMMKRQVPADGIDQQFFYNGKTFTVFDIKEQVYASVPAPATIKELLDVAVERYDVEMPLSDLFKWQADNSHEDRILAATYIGPTTVNNVLCDHYAFRNSDVDWQLWIEKSATPLPRRIVITTRDLETQPQFMANWNWNLSPRLKKQNFTFVPPAGVQKIEFAVVEANIKNKK